MNGLNQPKVAHIHSFVFKIRNFSIPDSPPPLPRRPPCCLCLCPPQYVQSLLEKGLIVTDGYEATIKEDGNGAGAFRRRD